MLLFVFIHLFLVFLMSIFGVRRYDSAYLKFTAFNDESVEKKNQFGEITGVSKSYLELARKDFLNENIYIF